MVFNNPYARDAYGVRVLWDSSRDMPVIDMPDFNRRAERVVAVAPEPWRAEIAERMRDSDHTGDTAHPYDASQLHAWELWLLEKDGFQVRGGDGAWTGPDGVVNVVRTAGVRDLSDVLGLAPVVRVWLADSPDALPFRFLLVEGRDPARG